MKIPVSMTKEATTDKAIIPKAFVLEPSILSKCWPGRFYILMFVVFFMTSIGAKTQTKWIDEIKWTNLMDGLHLAELDAPQKSVVNDSKLTILKIDVRKFEIGRASCRVRV